MSAEIARFDTRRAAQTDESSEQTDLRAIGAREQGQLALNEIEVGAARSENRASSDTPVRTNEPTREDFEAALGCARATIDGLRDQVEALEAERDRLREQTEADR